MDTNVRSYLKIGEKFELVDKYNEALPDEFYIEGAIVCSIDGKPFLDVEHWDLIDQLWAYIVEGLTKLQHGDSYESYFPDQPLRLRFTPLSEHVVEVAVGEVIRRFDRTTFVNTMTNGAEEFFKSMKRIVPNASDTWERYLIDAKALKH